MSTAGRVITAGVSSPAYQVMRTNTQTGARIADIASTEKEARQLIFWCATDNLGMARRQATAEANAAVVGEPYALGHYVFTIELGGV